LAGGLLVASLAGTALADRGSFEAAASFTTNYSKLEFAGQSITGGSIHGSATIIKSTGGLFPEGSSAVLDCIVYAKKSDVGLDLEAPCANTDQSGDKIFYIGTRRAGDMKAGGEGQQELLGGTGKYLGLTGSCSFKTDYLLGNLAVTRQKCQWQKP
jgi:hypothetical protein